MVTTRLQLGVITLFPKLFDALNFGITGRAIHQQLTQIDFWNPRDYCTDKHRTVDDRPYGGGPGMVMKYQPVKAAIMAAKAQLGTTTRVIHLSPQGQVLNQAAIAKLSQHSPLILLTSRYEGVDQRIIDNLVDEEWSVGDYIVSGGELPAMLLIDAMIRLLPGALGDANSAAQDSFSNGLLDHPHYTRPATIDALKVPPVLLNGDHAAIAKWRLGQTLIKTWQRRPDLLKRHTLTADEQELLKELIEELS